MIAQDRRSSDLVKVTYTTHARSTGATVEAGKTHEGWGVRCVDHGSQANHKTRLLAEAFASKPQEWCGFCLLIAQGKLPKIRA